MIESVRPNIDDFQQLKQVSIYGSRRQEGHIGNICQLIDTFLSRGIAVSIERKLASVLNSEGYRLAVRGIRECVRMPENTDIVVSIGGDGTFLRSAKWVQGREIPILGINTGHLGFLAENSVENSDGIIKALEAGEYSVEKRLVLEAVSEKIPSDEWPFALNEVAFLKSDSASMIKVKVAVDGHFLTDYSADGLLMATPTGSTAYNLSVGGPILDPTLNNIILSPVAPHTLTLRPLVLGAESEITATVTSRKGDFRLSIDGRSFVMPCGVEIRVRRAAHTVLALRRRGENFASSLRDKMRWGT